MATFETDILAFLNHVKNNTSLPPRIELNRFTLETTDSLYYEEIQLCGEDVIFDDEWDVDTEGIDDILQQPYETSDVTDETTYDVITIVDTPNLIFEDRNLTSVITIEDTPNSIEYSTYDDISDDYSMGDLFSFDDDDDQSSDCEFEDINNSAEDGPMVATVNMYNTEFLKMANSLGFYVIDGVLRKYEQWEL